MISLGLEKVANKLANIQKSNNATSKIFESYGYKSEEKTKGEKSRVEAKK